MIAQPVEARVATIGYSSIDYASRTGPFRGIGATTEVSERLSSPWPGHGGVFHFVRELCRRGVTTAPVTWIGADAHGREYLDALARLGADLRGVHCEGARSPTSQLFYIERGDPILFFDSGDCAYRFSHAQREVLTSVDWAVVSVAPKTVLSKLPTLLPQTTRVQWTVKADPRALTGPVAVALSERAEIITYSRSERDFLIEQTGTTPEGLADRGCLVVESHGPGGVVAWHGASRVAVPARAVAVRDTTGAGDTFAAALLASVLGFDKRRVSDLETDDVSKALERAIDAATAFLQDRGTSDEELA